MPEFTKQVKLVFVGPSKPEAGRSTEPQGQDPLGGVRYFSSLGSD